MTLTTETLYARPIGPKFTNPMMDVGSGSYKTLDAASAGPLRLHWSLEERLGPFGNGSGILFSYESKSYIFVICVSNENCTAVQNWKADRWLKRYNSNTRLCKSAWWTHSPKTLINMRTDDEVFLIRPSECDDSEVTDPEIPSDVVNFVGRAGIDTDLAKAIDAARRHFRGMTSLRVYLDRDPDDSEEYVVIKANSLGNPDDDTQAFMDYLDEWSASVEWPASQMIRLDLNWPVPNANC